MKEIELSKNGKNKGKYVALVDDEDFDRVNQFNWSVYNQGKLSYAGRITKINNVKKFTQMHCFIYGSKYIDHIDGDGLNNQRSNLRIANKSQNAMNAKKHTRSTSKYKGVYYYKRDNKWASQIVLNNKRYYLGLFADEIDAAKAYDKKAIELFGEFAKLNFKYSE